MKNLYAEAKELHDCIEKRKALDKRETELKSLFKNQMLVTKSDTMLIGDILISKTNKSKRLLDKDLLIQKFGASEISQCEKISEYAQIDVKQVEGFKKSNISI